MNPAPPPFTVTTFEQPLESPVVEVGELPRSVAQDVRHQRELLIVHDEVEHSALGARHREPRREHHLVARHLAPGKTRRRIPRIHPPGGVYPIRREVRVSDLEAAGLDRVVQGVARDAHALRLGRGEDAFGLGEPRDGPYVIRSTRVAIAGFYPTIATPHLQFKRFVSA